LLRHLGLDFLERASRVTAGHLDAETVGPIVVVIAGAEFYVGADAVDVITCLVAVLHGVSVVLVEWIVSPRNERMLRLRTTFTIRWSLKCLVIHEQESQDSIRG
jgi:hypothetical protein